ncbi:glycosyltransferase [Salinibacter altiplanensis]|uniref:glycosyltransferase n=1 Tax=Salinibacter altiplanensis TaxID=1803181 RepID=UPI000C9FDAA2|nr:glycosyltransferase [Salinibacter altiplanensis]
MPKSLLVFNECYVPAYKGGGPIRSIQNLCHHLGDDIKFNIITRDRDYGDQAPFNDVSCNEWNKVGKADVFYCSPRNQTLHGFYKIAKDVNYDAIYVNSFFEPWFGIQPQLLWRFSLLDRVPFILAPRGEFSPGAINIKKLKKHAYITLFKSLFTHRRVVWHASTSEEEDDIRKWMGDNTIVKVARNIPSIMEPSVDTLDEYKGPLDVVFLSRISRKKNLLYAVNLLADIDIPVNFNIYGVIDDKKYWQKCQQAISRLPETVCVNYKGAVPHSKVSNVFSLHDIFLFPTCGENFGHVIFESLSSGCPVLISDETPWTNLVEDDAGWVVPLTNPEGFQKVIRQYAGASDDERARRSENATTLAERVLHDSDTIDNNRKLFEQVLD